MELMTAVISTVTAGGAAGAGATAGAAAGAGGIASALTSASTLATIISGGLSLFSATQMLNAGDADAAMFEHRAQDAEEEIDLEALNGLERRASLKKQAHDAVGEQTVAFAASGVDLTFGAPVQTREETFADLDRALTTDLGTQETRISRLKERASSNRRQGRNAQRRARSGAVSQVGRFAFGVVNRG